RSYGSSVGCQHLEVFLMGLSFVRLSYVVDDWGHLVAVVGAVTSASSRDPSTSGDANEAPWGPLADGYRSGVNSVAVSPTGAPTPPSHGEPSYGGYTHVVDGAGQSRAVPEVDS